MAYNTLHIFTDDSLRLNDNVPLLKSLATTDKLFTVFFYGHIRNIRSPPLHRVLFLLDSLKDLKSRLAEYGVPLYLTGTPLLQTIRELILRWKIERVTTEQASSVAGMKSQLSLRHFLVAYGVRLETRNSNSLYNLSEFKSTPSRSEFFNALATKEPLSPLSKGLTACLHQFASPPDQQINREVPTLQDFGITEGDTGLDTKFFGGESIALQQLERLISARCNTEIPQTKLAQLCGHEAISPAIKFGCISVRTVYSRVSDLRAEHEEAINRIYDGLKNRDFYLLLGQVCPNVDNQGSIYAYLLPWDEKEEVRNRFHAGETGYPIVDAAVAQLMREGFVQASVKKILVRIMTCDLVWLGWQEGVKMFYKWSLDYNPAICGLSWMEGSHSTWLIDEIPSTQTNPLEEAKELDSDGEYIRRYLPKLRDYPKAHIHTPWTAPLEVQTDSNCVIGQDYPLPVYSDVEERFELCRKRLRTFYNLIKMVKGRRRIPVSRKRGNNNDNNDNDGINCTAARLSSK